MAKTLVSILIIFLGFFSCSGEEKGKNEQTVSDFSGNTKSLENFLLVGMFNGKPALYKYNMKEKKYSVFWSDKKEKVAEIAYSNDRRNAYFLTARDFGNLPESGLPFINKVKVYLLNMETGRISFLENIGSGLQVFASWEDNNNFKVIFNSVDKIISNYVQQRTRLYNTFGKKLQDVTETYDITIQGYPLANEKKLNSVSSDGRYSVNYGKDSLSIYLRDSEENKQYIITKKTGKLKQIEWSNKHLFFTALDPDTTVKERLAASKLFIYSIDKKKILKMFESIGYFFIMNDFIVFDTLSGENASITVYNYITGKSDKINIKNGCGIKNVFPLTLTPSTWERETESPYGKGLR